MTKSGTSTCQPAGSDVSTRKTNLGYIRWTIKPAFGSTQVRKVRGPLAEYGAFEVSRDVVTS